MRRSQSTRLALSTAAFLFVAGSLVFFNSPVYADWKYDIGYTQLAAELGSSMPTGSSVTVTQVEAADPASSTNYSPNPSNSALSGVSFTYEGLATSGSVSSHATTVATYFYGSKSLVSGVTDATIWDAGSWLSWVGNKESTDVVNCSWIATSSQISASNATIYSQLLDYSIRDSDYVAVVGVNNDDSPTLPYLLCQSYNSISVGLTNGNHSSGTTTLNGAGRIKPEIVAPASATSWATAMVSSAAALLVDASRSISTTAGTNSAIKAVLLAGATKSEFSDWSHTHDRPLDDTYGAGELNVDRSYHILAGGQHSASATRNRTTSIITKTAAGNISDDGWDYSRNAANTEKLYYFSVGQGETVSELSAVLTWNAVVISSGSSLTTTVANLDLYLYSVSDTGTLTQLDLSDSSVDNVELLYETYLASGDYAFGVTGTANTYYGLAWHIAVPEPGAAILLITALIAGIRISHRRRGRNG
ncbi:MAG: S8/S53 family peptidase [Thermoguttaceae bacterium]